MNPKQNKNIGFKFFVVFLIGIILLFSKKENQEKFIDFIKTSKIISKELKVEESIPMDIDIKEIGFYDGGIILWGDNKLRRLRLNGDIEWEKEFNIDEALAYLGKEEIYICERTTGQIYIINPKGETIEKFQLNMEIYNIAESSGNILIHIKEGDKEILKILDKKGDLIGENLIENENILTYCIDENNKCYALATLSLKGENIKSEIQTYGLEGEFLWTAYLDNEIAMYLNFDDQNNLIILSDKGIYQIDDGSILWKKQFQLIKDIYMDGKNLYVLHGNTLEMISFDGRTIKKDSFTEEYKKILPFNNYTVLYGKDHITGLKEGKEVFKYKTEDSIVNVIQGTQKLLVVFKHRIDIISL